MKVIAENVGLRKGSYSRMIRYSVMRGPVTISNFKQEWGVEASLPQGHHANSPKDVRSPGVVLGFGDGAVASHATLRFVFGSGHGGFRR